MDGLNKVVITITSVPCEAQACSGSERPVFVRRSVPSYTLDNALSNRLFGQQKIGDYENRCLSRGTIAQLRGLSINIESTNRVRAVTTSSIVVHCATDMLVRVYIDRYFGHQHDLEMTSDSLPFEQHLLMDTNQHLPIGYSDRCAMTLIGTYYC